MRIETVTFTVEYRMFDVGEKVKPTSPRCPLDPGVYIVTACFAPKDPGDQVTVFVEGRQTGISGEYLTTLDE